MKRHRGGNEGAPREEKPGRIVAGIMLSSLRRVTVPGLSMIGHSVVNINNDNMRLKLWK